MTPEALYAAASTPHVPEKNGVDLVKVQENYEFAIDGSNVYIQYFVYKVLSPAGAENWNDLGIDWSPWRDQRPELKARVALDVER